MKIRPTERSRGDLANWVSYLREMGVTELQVTAPARGTATEKLKLIRDELGDCKRCKLHASRTKIVFGVGNPEAKLMFVGEGPGENEDATGEPFVGRAGKKLDEMITAIGLSRAQVYIANIVKCRPPETGTPSATKSRPVNPFCSRRSKRSGHARS